MAASTRLTPEQRSQRARIAALTRWAHENPTKNALRGQAGLIRRFENEVDPDRVLPEAERNRRVQALRRAHMITLARKSAKARKKRADSPSA